MFQSCSIVPNTFCLFQCSNCSIFFKSSTHTTLSAIFNYFKQGLQQKKKYMLDATQIRQIKDISIVDYLASLGHQPAKTHGNEYVYFSPIRNEHTPSFFVNPAKNVYKDWGKDGGDIIKLVMELSSCDFLGAVSSLNSWKPGMSCGVISVQPIQNTHQVETGIEILEVKPLAHEALINYLNSRRIPFSFAAHYLKEIHYINKRKRFFSIGFANDNGGWALRNARFKNCVGTNGITYFEVPGSTAISVFEGFFDFLSALVYFQVAQSKNSVIVLNSTSNLKSSFSILAKYGMVYTYLDNDAAGIKAVQELQRSQFPISDKAYLYASYKDFSEMLCCQTKT
jgi:DNA primase